MAQFYNQQDPFGQGYEYDIFLNRQNEILSLFDADRITIYIVDGATLFNGANITPEYEPGGVRQLRTGSRLRPSEKRSTPDPMVFLRSVAEQKRPRGKGRGVKGQKSLLNQT